MYVHNINRISTIKASIKKQTITITLTEIFTQEINKDVYDTWQGKKIEPFILTHIILFYLTPVEKALLTVVLNAVEDMPEIPIVYTYILSFFNATSTN